MYLLYDERRFLQACHYFLGVIYHDNNHLDMLLAQNMVAFLQRIGWMHTDFEFLLSGEDGMYSPGFHAFLLKMNEKSELIASYQSSDKYYGEISVNDCKTLVDFNGTYLIDWHLKDLLNWLKCLSMVLYIKEVKFGGIEFPFEEVRDRVWLENKWLPEEFIREAYDLL